ncbi:MAG: hypothetical protein OXK76_09065 [Gammaproteobacteria bacterium]|nr:hypothetical protein [Gammaproteobacteria bacterium]
MTDFVATADAYVLTGATCVLAIATWQLARTTRRQTVVMQERQQRTLDRDKPKIELRQCTTTVVRPGLDAPVSENKHFHGFTAVNAGAVPVTIVGVAAHFAVKAGVTMERRQVPVLPPATEWRGTDLGTGPVPAKLNPGDTVKVLFDADALHERGRPVQWRCQDSLGNVHASGTWVTVPEPNSISGIAELGDEFDVLPNAMVAWSTISPQPRSG